MILQVSDYCTHAVKVRGSVSVCDGVLIYEFHIGNDCLGIGYFLISLQSNFLANKAGLCNLMAATKIVWFSEAIQLGFISYEVDKKLNKVTFHFSQLLLLGK